MTIASYLALRAIDGVDPDGVGGREPFDADKRLNKFNFFKINDEKLTALCIRGVVGGGNWDWPFATDDVTDTGRSAESNIRSELLARELEPARLNIPDKRPFKLLLLDLKSLEMLTSESDPWTCLNDFIDWYNF